MADRQVILRIPTRLRDVRAACCKSIEIDIAAAIRLALAALMCPVTSVMWRPALICDSRA
jgi:hypothetical protein